MAYFQKVKAKNKRGYNWKCTDDAPRHPVTGKRRQITRRAETKQEAEEKVKKAIEEIKRNDSCQMGSSSRNITVKELFDQWFELIMKRKLKETTYREYTNAVNYRIIPIFGDRKVTELNSILLQKYINDLIDEGLSLRYIEYISTIFHGALEAARKWKVITVNPLNDVEKPRPRRKENVTWTRKEMDLFLKVTKLKDLRLYTVVSVAVKTGARRGEVLALKWSDIDFEKKEINIERTLIYDKDGYRFGTPKSDSSVRKVSIGESLITDLNQWKAYQNEFKMFFRKIYKDEDLLFTTNKGKPIFPRNLTADFNRAIKIAEVRKIRFHDLRHTHATLCLEAGMSLKEVQDRLGHSSIRTTGDVYAHVTENMREQSANLFEKYISK